MTDDNSQLTIPNTELPEPDGASAFEDIDVRIRRMSRRSFLWAGAVTAGAFTGWRWLVTREDDHYIPWPLRRVLKANERLASAIFNPTRLAPTFDRSLAEDPRPNGNWGLDSELDPDSWSLEVRGDNPATLTLRDIKALQKVDMTAELKCIEGWSTIVHWAGARFADFARKHHPGKLPAFVALSTPDDGYYVGMDMPSAMHPQTLLCYEMNGKPLTPEHGAPLRLVTPVKYGIKHIKRIGSIRFTDQRPADFWAEQGYDWYAGH